MGMEFGINKENYIETLKIIPISATRRAATITAPILTLHLLIEE